VAENYLQIKEKKIPDTVYPRKRGENKKKKENVDVPRRPNEIDAYVY
jgi:hypothetical protein